LIVADEVEALERAAADGEQSELAGKRVLIVDDNASNRLLLKLQTERWGMRARDTNSPAVALEWIVQGDPFDVALLDCQMPEMDGIALAREKVLVARDPWIAAPCVIDGLEFVEEAVTALGYSTELASHLFRECWVEGTGSDTDLCRVFGWEVEAHKYKVHLAAEMVAYWHVRLKSGGPLMTVSSLTTDFDGHPVVNTTTRSSRAPARVGTKMRPATA
jgi:hypothetical protein